MRGGLVLSAAVVASAAAVLLALPGRAGAQEPPPSTVQSTSPPSTAPAPIDESESGVVGGAGEQTPVTLPLVPVPPGCTAPALPYIVFVGRVVDRDYRSVRFEIEQVRAGRVEPFGNGGLIDVRYGLDAQYLEDGERYLVSAPVQPELGLLVSRVTPPVEDFGGDEVIGVSESDVNCPPFDDPMRTLTPDGSTVEADILAPLLSERARIVGAILVPIGIGAGVIFALAMLRLSVSGLTNGFAEAGRRRA